MKIVYLKVGFMKLNEKVHSWVNEWKVKEYKDFEKSMTKLHQIQLEKSINFKVGE